MPDIDIPALTHTVLWSTFALTFLFGAILQRTHFCTMGAISDIVNIGDWSRMRMWVMAIGVAMIGTGALAWAGLIDPTKTIYTSAKLAWLSAAVGGLMFGFGMVLASGCGSKTLVRIGAGNLKSLVVFVFLGLSAYMALRGLFGVVRVNTVDTVAVALPVTQDPPSLVAQWQCVARSIAATGAGRRDRRGAGAVGAGGTRVPEPRQRARRPWRGADHRRHVVCVRPSRLCVGRPEHARGTVRRHE